jgi:hypothetical protein
MKFGSGTFTKNLSRMPEFRQNRLNENHTLLLLLLLLFIWTANGFVPGGSGTTVRHNTQNNTPHSKHNTQNYKKRKGHILNTTNTITIQIQLQIQYTYKYNYKYNTHTIQIQLQLT